MLSKETIIDNISQYLPRQIVDYMKRGIITVQEILDENPEEFDFKKRTDVEQMLWDDARQAHDPALAAIYLKNYPSGKFSFEAKELADSDPLAQPAAPPPVENIEVPQPEFQPLDPWEAVDKTNIESINMFLELNPYHPMAREARKLVNQLIREAEVPRGPEWLKRELAGSSKNPMVLVEIVIEAFENQRITPQELRALFAQDPNFLPREAVEILFEDGYLTGKDLEMAGIDRAFVGIIDKTNPDFIDSPVSTDFMQNPQMINQVCQEIYFWGMPSSGKTCALGAILSAAGTGHVAKTIEKNPGCRGYDYMRQLSQIFEPGKISVLPTGTSASFVSDMSFWLLDQEDRRHSVTMIDLAGEMLHAMYLVDQGLYNQLTPDQQTGYSCMRNLLVDNRSRNSKIHFFVLEYGGHERREKGITFLDGISEPIDETETLPSVATEEIHAEESVEGVFDQIIDNMVEGMEEAAQNEGTPIIQAQTDAVPTAGELQNTAAQAAEELAEQAAETVQAGAQSDGAEMQFGGQDRQDEISNMIESFTAKEAEPKTENTSNASSEFTSRVKNASEELEMLKSAKLGKDESKPTETTAQLVSDQPIVFTRADGSRLEIRPTEIVDQTMRIIEQAIQETKEQSEYSLVLNPEELGRITVKLIKAADGAVSVTIAAENAHTQRVLEQHSELMQNNLRNNGINLEHWQTVNESRQEAYAQDYSGSSKNPYFRRDDAQNDDEDNGDRTFADIIAAM